MKTTWERACVSCVLCLVDGWMGGKRSLISLVSLVSESYLVHGELRAASHGGSDEPRGVGVLPPEEAGVDARLGSDERVIPLVGAARESGKVLKGEPFVARVHGRVGRGRGDAHAGGVSGGHA